MRKLLGATVAAGGAIAAYSLYEPYRFRLVSRTIPAASGAPALDIVHLSDTHVTGGDAARLRFIASVPERLGRTPDLVLVTGDMIEGNEGIDPVLDAVSTYEARVGIFYVLGSHDYFRSKFKIPTHYLGGVRARVTAPPADVARLTSGLDRLGWVPLTNRSEIVRVPRRAPDEAPEGGSPRAAGEAPEGGSRRGADESPEGSRRAAAGSATVRLAGVDDPYLKRHRTDHIERRAGEDYAIGLTHSPEVVTEYVLNGFDLVLAGHTHGGQIRLPGIGALVTNSSLPARLAGGLHRIGNGWLHVSTGMGTSRFTPIRLGAPPEITLLQTRSSSE